MKEENILVTGGAGFIGSALVDALLERFPQAQIIVLDNLVNGRQNFLPDTTRVVLRQIDLRNEEDVTHCLDEFAPKTVFHLAALHFIPYCNAHPTETLAVNVIGTQNVLEALRKTCPMNLVIASSAAVYPISTTPNQEDDASGPTDIYGLSKAVNESQLKLFATQNSKVRCAAARFFNVYGPRETNPHVIPEILEQAANTPQRILLGNTEPKRDYIYVTDVAQALIAIALNNQHRYRIYNVGTGQEYSVGEILEHLSAITGSRLEATVAPDRVRRADRMHLLADVSRISQEIGWSPKIDLRQGLRQLWRNESGAEH
jgi:UDP-glucose 4-epimerase